ncbi:probable mitochondrial saccharopine dehydrogenase-like oxidoreductase [Tanacetum coccineum]
MHKLFSQYGRLIHNTTFNFNASYSTITLQSRRIHRDHSSIKTKEQQKDNQKPIYDVIIFGASGFTGKYVVKEALKFLSSPSSPLKTLALAGRNTKKLSETLAWASTSPLDRPIPFVIADTSNPASLHHMATQAKLILNCAGPFRYHGERVLNACVDVGCDYLDISGESDFIKRMEVVYHERAVKNGSLCCPVGFQIEHETGKRKIKDRFKCIVY